MTHGINVRFYFWCVSVVDSSFHIKKESRRSKIFVCLFVRFVCFCFSVDE